MVERRREPQPVTHHGARNPATAVVKVVDVGVRYQIRVQLQNLARYCAQNLQPHIRGYVVGAEGAVGAIERGVPMKLIRSRPCNHVDYESAAGGVCSCVPELIVCLLERKRIGIEGRRGSDSIALADIHAVDQVGAVVGAAVQREIGVREGFGPADVDLVSDDARNGAGDGPQVDAIGQRLQRFVGHDGLLQRGCRVEQRRLSGHRDALFKGADRQRQVGACGRIGIDDDVALLEFAEPLQRRRDAIRARHEPEKLIVPPFVARRFPTAADGTLGVGERHRGAR